MGSTVLSAVCGMQCAVYNVQCAVYSVKYAVHSVQCAVLGGVPGMGSTTCLTPHTGAGRGQGRWSCRLDFTDVTLVAEDNQ